MLTKPIPEFFSGPLGSHRNYLRHIAFQNHLEYLRCEKAMQEQGDSTNPAKYNKLRLFLNSVESLNNILDYLYFEHEGRIGRNQAAFRKSAGLKVPILDALSIVANSYKHCVRYEDGKYLKRASELQRTHVSVDLQINMSDPSSARADAAYTFSGPLREHESILKGAFEFWLDYYNNGNTDELIKKLIT
jgi:hypothetical protein